MSIQKHFAVTIATLSLMAGCALSDEDFTDEDIGVELEYEEADDLEAVDVGSCRLVDQPQDQVARTANIDIEFQRRGTKLQLVEGAWVFKGYTGSSNKVEVQVQYSKNGKWYAVANGWQYQKHNIPNNTVQHVGIGRSYYVGNYKTRLLVKASWTQRLWPDSSKTCYMH